jgi:hypothetical protein
MRVRVRVCVRVRERVHVRVCVRVRERVRVRLRVRERVRESVRVQVRVPIGVRGRACVQIAHSMVQLHDGDRITTSECQTCVPLVSVRLQVRHCSLTSTLPHHNEDHGRVVSIRVGIGNAALSQGTRAHTSALKLVDCCISVCLACAL